MAAAVDIGTLIVRTPGIRGGQLRIAGTGISVMAIVSGAAGIQDLIMVGWWEESLRPPGKESLSGRQIARLPG